jgi:hypothetical protein
VNRAGRHRIAHYRDRREPQRADVVKPHVHARRKKPRARERGESDAEIARYAFSKTTSGRTSEHQESGTRSETKTHCGAFAEENPHCPWQRRRENGRSKKASLTATIFRRAIGRSAD